MSEDTRRETTIVIDGRVLPRQLDEQMIRDVVHGFYAKIQRDALLAPLFNKSIAPHDWPPHLTKMCDFWSSLMLRTGRYDGRPLPPHLTLPGLGEQHFRRWLFLFRATVNNLCPPEIAALFMERALRIAHSFRLALAHNRGESTLTVEPITAESL
ncbi:MULTISPECIES: group III truncated hemoglobin [Aminobacter]|uniref:Hemoglobin n=1 Tax=Aminobacter ciceronei TaxID=150723 RepID=A0ABR6CGA8_9HYPH|nr:MULTISPECIES: group III truncated hemoglobin [Aminobacter]MBA8909866.1 hemoglobin [Aminobacter ciceronei]MBA9023638.1 hemoglobin [Aminobacter ciceronei]MRX36365.1 preprotein translocase subunit TatC [Aminobacter sp. MDW-2]QNH33823.1 group III truncated hemoglobin [Aminobacter sp. MDW-2]